MRADNKHLKIGILGGTFNPIHNGHLAIAKCAYKEFGLDKVLIMPSGISYFKKNTNVLPAAVRSRIAEIAIKGIEYFVLDDRETKREGNSYTCDTIDELIIEYPADTEFYYIIGADTLKSIASWRNPEVIFKHCILLTALRDGETIASLDDVALQLKNDFNADIRYLHIPYYDISSTHIREMAAAHEDFSEYVPPEVCDYIKEKGIYKNED